jgi:hypothetical protein
VRRDGLSGGFWSAPSFAASAKSLALALCERELEFECVHLVGEIKAWLWQMKGMEALMKVGFKRVGVGCMERSLQLFLAVGHHSVDQYGPNPDAGR